MSQRHNTLNLALKDLRKKLIEDNKNLIQCLECELLNMSRSDDNSIQILALENELKYLKKVDIALTIFRG